MGNTICKIVYSIDLENNKDKKEKKIEENVYEKEIKTKPLQSPYIEKIER
tara:strand:- start:685 stop:834 length:150 start_codon:yes stop_codon:yes gene_type:complete